MDNANEEQPHVMNVNTTQSDHFGIGESDNNHGHVSGENNGRGLDDLQDEIPINGDQIDGIAINGLQEMGNISFHTLSALDMMKYHFPNIGVAFTFYNWYARLNGFSARKSKLRRNKVGDIIQQNFVCYRQGFKEDRFGDNNCRQREARADTRCGCEAKCHVHIDYQSGRWYIRYFNDVHNHELVDEKFVGLLPGHRTMDDDDILRMNNFRKAGIRTPQIYGWFASQSGGYENIGFVKQDMYNEAVKERRSQGSDASAALAYLRSLKSSDPAMYWRHTIDNNDRLERLFWCDGRSQSDYSVFGDVLAFDATYKKNRYKCPLVIFSGVNHHNQTIVFGSAIVVKETEETYVWLLEQFLDAMGGKTPISVITDGDLAMRKAIRRVFPDAHHRLCAWHLLRNATSNVKNPRFTSLFKRCMLGDYEIPEFERKWNEMVMECGVEDNTWVSDQYEKKEMWATAHIRGKFFAGFRTTSRCEGLHAQVSKFVHSDNNLTEFLEHFKMCIEYFRFKEVEADFASIHGQRALKTPLQKIERSASKVYTKDVFLVFRSILLKACQVKVVSCKETATCKIFFVTKYCRYGPEWIVSFSPLTMNIKCSCLRMESYGIPCDHIVRIMVHLDMVELPMSVVLDRWTKKAKDSISSTGQGQSSGWDSMKVCRFKALNERSRDVNELGSKTAEDFEETLELLTTHYQRLKIKQGLNFKDNSNYAEHSGERHLQNPIMARSKGCNSRGLSRQHRGRRTVHCGLCGAQGHNRQTCRTIRQRTIMGDPFHSGCNLYESEENNSEENDCYLDTVETSHG